MNILLWIFQILLALHTAVGAVWKYSHSAEQTMPSLHMIPNGVWLGLGVLEILCAVALLLPLFKKRFSPLAPIAAIIIAAEMLLFCGLHISSGAEDKGPMIYWLVVAVICAFIAYGRSVRKPS
jgi:heme/copper-type cytochrome/quinol oxidase subunit 4